MSRFIDFNANNKDTHTEDEGHRLRVRSTLLMVFFACLLLGFFSILYRLQVVQGPSGGPTPTTTSPNPRR